MREKYDYILLNCATRYLIDVIRGNMQTSIVRRDSDDFASENRFHYDVKRSFQRFGCYFSWLKKHPTGTILTLPTNAAADT